MDMVIPCWGINLQCIDYRKHCVSKKRVEYRGGEIPFRDVEGCHMTEDIVRLHGNMKNALGVSATHLDWTMVPYVRKSFGKHYIDGLRHIEKLSEEEIERDTSFDEGYSWADVSIEEDSFAYNDAWNYAMAMTKRELKQAAEGMYHNLNTLMSRSGNQLQ